jgi:hypothetical protein
VTLDLCGYTFKSESRRLDRVQVNYSKPGAAVSASNEVVAYRAGGAALAMRELATAAKTCPTGAQDSTIAGLASVRYRVRFLPTKGLPAGSIGLAVHIDFVRSGNHELVEAVTFCVRRGDILSLMYGFGGTDAQRQALALRSSAASAKRLATAS